MSDIYKKAWEYVKATQAMEGFYLTPEQEDLIQKVLEGKITEEEFHQQALELAKLLH